MPANCSQYLVLGDDFDPSKETAVAGPGKGGKQLERLDEGLLHDVLRIHVLPQLASQLDANALRDVRPQCPVNVFESESIAGLGVPDKFFKILLRLRIVARLCIGSIHDLLNLLKS